MTRTAVVTLEDGREAEVDVEFPDAKPSSLAGKSLNIVKEFSPSLAERAVGILRRPELSLPLAPVMGVPAMRKVAEVLPVAEKKYPAENLLPSIGGIAGGFAGGTATLPSGAGIPFGATVGAGAGGAAGEALRQKVRELRGKPSDEGSIAVEGITQAGAEIGTGLLFRFLKTLGAGKLAKEGMKKFSGKLSEMFTPANKTVTESAFNRIKDIPVIDTVESETVKSINDIFGKRGISATGQILSPAQAKNFADAGMTQADIKLLSESMSSVRESVSKIAKGKSGITLKSELATTPLNKYQELGNVLNDLDLPNLTYERLRQVRQRIGDVANLDKPDIARTPIEKLYGTVYHNLGLDMAKTAEKEGMLPIHNQVMEQSRKFYQEKLFKNVIEQSTTRTKGIDRIKYSDLANELKGYTEDELVRKFGDDAKYIKALRDLAETHAETFGQGAALTPRISTTARIYGTINPHAISRLRTPVYIDTILGKHLGKEGVREYKNILFNNLQTAQKVTATTGKIGLAIGLPHLENQ